VYIDAKVKSLSSAVFGSETEVHEFSEVTGSVIGKEVKIGKGCKIKNSIIMEGVSIKDDVVIENSIIGKSVEIQSKCFLKNCYVANNLVLNFPEEEKTKIIENMRIKLDLNNESCEEGSLSDESTDLYGDTKKSREPIIRQESISNFNNEKNEEQILKSEKNLKKLEMIDNETFLMNLEDRDYMFTCLDQKETNDEDSENQNIHDELDELDNDFTESEQVVQEIMALKFSFKYKTFSDSN